jgi:sporulation protein YlmC with PRC-barrel domain
MIMRRKLGMTAFALVLFFPLSAVALEPVQAGAADRLQDRTRTGGGAFDMRELSTADDFKGMKVQDRQGMRIGEVDRLILDPAEGRIAYVVVSALRGSKGRGEVIVPWNAVQVQGAKPSGVSGGDRVLVVKVPRDELMQTPEGGMRTVRDQGRQIHQFYGVSPYWEEGQSPQLEPMQEPATSLPPGHPPLTPPGHSPFSPPREE